MSDSALPPDPQNSLTNSTHHLMRVRIRTQTFDRLAEIARAESRRSGDHTTVSDLVRAALTDYITVYDSTTKLAIFQSDPMRKSVG
jgi:hypothetical protein